jgi:hypothetical protein
VSASASVTSDSGAPVSGPLGLNLKVGDHTEVIARPNAFVRRYLQEVWQLCLAVPASQTLERQPANARDAAVGSPGVTFRTRR